MSCRNDRMLTEQCEMIEQLDSAHETHRCIFLPYIQRIRTQNSHIHNTTPPLQILIKVPYPLPTPLPIPPTPPQPKHRHTSNTPPVPTGLVKPKPNPLIHSPPLHSRRPRQIHIHLTYSTNSSHPTHQTHP